MAHIFWSIHECTDISQKGDWSEWDLESYHDEATLSDFTTDELAKIDFKGFKIFLKKTNGKDELELDYTETLADVELCDDGIILFADFQNGDDVPVKFQEELDKFKHLIGTKTEASNV